MNNQEQKTQTSTIHFSDYELRNEVLKNQALNDAYSDAKLYVQVYDSAFESLKNTAVTNLLQAKISEQKQQLEDRETQNFLLMNPEQIMLEMNKTRQLLASPSNLNCRYLPQSLGTIMMI
ncbi:hypothetical protein [Planktothrix sp.]|uniref:hypothetical protein n=1 Tax=Planktothrix sp. TaxID=3088171 RepID=UPI0038D5173E